MDVDVGERIVAETRGNPLALLELPRGLSPEQLAGGFGLPNAVPLSSRIEESFLRRLEELAEETRLLLLVAAAEPVGDPALLWRAAERLAITGEAVEPAEGQACSTLPSGPLSRSAGALGGLPDRVVRRPAKGAPGAGGGDRPRARSRSPRLAPRARCAGPDEEVAAELERSAGRAQLRGAWRQRRRFSSEPSC